MASFAPFAVKLFVSLAALALLAVQIIDLFFLASLAGLAVQIIDLFSWRSWR